MVCTQTASFPAASTAIHETTSPSYNSLGASFVTSTVPGHASPAVKMGRSMLKAKDSPGSAFKVTVGGQLVKDGSATSGEHGFAELQLTLTVRTQVAVLDPTDAEKVTV